ncbi:MAG: hypothetical protein HDS26_00370 [Bacteroides sp.]|nr:hypothetical protein [Bacteroides sp.]
MLKTFPFLIVLIFAFYPCAAGAQTNIMSAFNAIINCKEAQVTETHSLSKDPTTGKKDGQCDVYRFVIPKAKFYLVKNVLSAFDKDSQKAYSLNSGKSEKYDSRIMLAVGDGSGIGEYVDEKKRDYIYALFLAPQSEDYEGIYRYAYAFNYEEEKEKIIGKIAITYATTLKYRQQLANSSNHTSNVYTNNHNAYVLSEDGFMVPSSDKSKRSWFEVFMTYVQSMASAGPQTRIALATKLYGVVRDISEYSRVKAADKDAAREILKSMIADKKYSETILNNLLNQCLINLK